MLSELMYIINEFTLTSLMDEPANERRLSEGCLEHFPTTKYMPSSYPVAHTGGRKMLLYFIDICSKRSDLMFEDESSCYIYPHIPAYLHLPAYQRSPHDNTPNVSRHIIPPSTPHASH